MDKGTAAKLLADSQTNEGGVKQGQIEVQDWFRKFNEYKGTNGDDLAQGWIRATLDTGIMADAYEEYDHRKIEETVVSTNRSSFRSFRTANFK